MNFTTLSLTLHVRLQHFEIHHPSCASFMVGTKPDRSLLSLLSLLDLITLEKASSRKR